MVSSVWPKTKMRLEQIGLELSLDNEQQSPMPTTTENSSTSTSSSSSSFVANRLASLGLNITNAAPTISAAPITTTTASSSTSSETGVGNGQLDSRQLLRLDNTNRHHLPLGGAGRRTQQINLSTPRSLGNNSTQWSTNSPICGSGSMSVRISNEFKKNMFFANPDQPPMTTNLQPEEVFEELDILGTGSGGNVLKMRHKPTGKICAVKQMRRTLNDEENKRIYMDLQVVLQCECDNIVRCCGYFIQESEVWICMELMTTCFDKLLKTRKKPLPEKFLGAIAVSAVKALYYLKEKHNIIHRDVKPSNILINNQGQIKLCDFGISGRLIDSLAKTRAAGCIPYMAPERIEICQSYDIRADVWSLGITLFELATGRSPYSECHTDFDLLVNLVNSDPPVLPCDMDFSPEFRNFISSCLTKDFKHRPKYIQLIEHEFLLKHKNTVANLSELDD